MSSSTELGPVRGRFVQRLCRQMRGAPMLAKGGIARRSQDMLSQHGAPVVVPLVPHDLANSEQQR